MADRSFALQPVAGSVDIMRMIVAAMAALAVPTQAAETVRLSPGDIAVALDAAERRPAEETLGFDDIRPARRIHGEVGAFIGTGGARGAFGTVVTPLGDNGVAAFSFSTERFGNYRRR